MLFLEHYFFLSKLLHWSLYNRLYSDIPVYLFVRSRSFVAFLIKMSMEKAKQGCQDAIDKTVEELGKAQRTATFVFHKAVNACDNFYENVHSTIECVNKEVKTTKEDKEMSLKERCVMINEWNRGVYSKRYRIETHAKGTPIQSYEPKLPGRQDLPKDATEPKHSRIKPTPERRAMVNYNRSLADDNLSPIMEGNEELSPPPRDNDERKILDAELGIENHDDMSLWPLETQDDDDGRNDVDSEVIGDSYWYTKRMSNKACPINVENEVIVKREKQSKSFFQMETPRDETIDRIMNIWKKNLKGHKLAE